MLPRSRAVFWLTVLLLVACWGAAPTLQPATQAPSGPRLVVIGDVHGDADAFASILQRAGLTNSSGEWTGGNAIFVQTGDLMDRGPKVRSVLDLMMRLEPQAAANGGRVIVLLGNHEAMNLLAEPRDVTPAIFASFADGESEARREVAYAAYTALCAARAKVLRPVPAFYQPIPRDAWMAAHPPGFLEYREALDPEGRYGKWLRARPAVAQVGDTVFLHGGIHPEFESLTVAAINDRVAREIRAFDENRRQLIDSKLILPFFTLQEIVRAASIEAAAIKNATSLTNGGRGHGGDPAADPRLVKALDGLLKVGDTFALYPNGPLWFRGFATWSDAEGPPQVAKLLERYHVAHFIVGHTVTLTKRITPRFGGQVFLIDTGMLSRFFQGGRASALEIQDGRFTAIYEDQRTPLD